MPILRAQIIQCAPLWISLIVAVPGIHRIRRQGNSGIIFVGNIRRAAGFFGLVLLFWTVIKVLSNIEASFNSIWGVRQPRSIVRKFSDYLSIILISPLLVILQSSATVFITTQISAIADRIALIGFFSPLITLSFKLIPYVLVWVLFTMLYLVMPNTRVKFSSGLVAGVIAGTVYQLFQWFYISLQVGAARYNAIYGSFAALPLFLVWLQVSWTIVLFGAEISFAKQHARDHEFESDTEQASPGLRKMVALQIARLVVLKFVAVQATNFRNRITQIYTISQIRRIVGVAFGDSDNPDLLYATDLARVPLTMRNRPPP